MVDDRLKSLAQHQPYPHLFVTVSGAHLYGFPSRDSDYDLRGIHVLTAREVLGLRARRDTIETSEELNDLDIDLVTHDAEKFFRLLLSRNGYVLEQLYSPLVVQTTAEHEELRAIARGCITRHHAHHYLGFARNQWTLFQKHDPPEIKPLLYVYRVLLTGIRLMESGEVEANLLHMNERFGLEYIDDLVAQKCAGSEHEAMRTGDLDLHRREYARLTEALEQAQAKSSLPDHASCAAALDELLVRVRLSGLSQVS